MAGRSGIAAIVVAAGRGRRAGPGLPKQWRDLRGKTVAAHTIGALRSHPRIDCVVLVLHPDDIGMAAGWLARPDMRVAEGGETRTQSVRAGLELLAADPPDLVLIHDVARPLVSSRIIDDVIEALGTHPGAAPALPVVDALWHGMDGIVAGIRDREGLYRAQTPQGFRFDAILAVHRGASDEAADDVSLARAAGLTVGIVPGDERNLKITGPDDFARAAALMEVPMDVRCGTGFDVHAFTPGDGVTLCGLTIPHDRALTGHSDADVGMHALTDALYGALAEGDIGRHFPPSDPRWKGAASRIFLDHARKLVRSRGFRIANCDVTLLCERPKIGPHAVRMAGILAEILQIDPSRVSVKATTTERLGFTGREEGIAAMASVALLAE